jgi:hypothetical protein
LRRILIALFLIPHLCLAGGENDPAGARSAALGNSGVTFTDIWSIFHNQAGIAHLEGFAAGAFFENRFLISDFAYSGFGVANPLGKGSLGLTFTNMGFSVYQENNLGLAYGLMLNEKLSVGVRLNYHSVRINTDGYGQRSVLTGDIGFRLQVSEKVNLAAHLANPTRSELDEFDDERIPTVLRFGAGYDISDEVMVTGEFEKDIDQKFLFRGGIEYQPAEILFIRVGASNEPNLFAFGLGLNFGDFVFDIASTYHSNLGYSPQVSLTYAPRKK